MPKAIVAQMMWILSSIHCARNRTRASEVGCARVGAGHFASGVCHACRGARRGVAWSCMRRVASRGCHGVTRRGVARTARERRSGAIRRSVVPHAHPLLHICTNLAGHVRVVVRRIEAQLRQRLRDLFTVAARAAVDDAGLSLVTIPDGRPDLVRALLLLRLDVIPLRGARAASRLARIQEAQERGPLWSR